MMFSKFYVKIKYDERLATPQNEIRIPAVLPSMSMLIFPVHNINIYKVYLIGGPLVNKCIKTLFEVGTLLKRLPIISRFIGWITQII